MEGSWANTHGNVTPLAGDIILEYDQVLSWNMTLTAHDLPLRNTHSFPHGSNQCLYNNTFPLSGAIA